MFLSDSLVLRLLNVWYPRPPSFQTTTDEATTDRAPVFEPDLRRCPRKFWYGDVRGKSVEMSRGNISGEFLDTILKIELDRLRYNLQPCDH